MRKGEQTNKQGASAYSPVHAERELCITLDRNADPFNWRGLNIPAFFSAETDNFGCPFARQRGGAGFLLPTNSAALLFKFCEQFTYDALKTSHAFFLTNVSNNSINHRELFGHHGTQITNLRNKFGVLRNETIGA